MNRTLLTGAVILTLMFAVNAPRTADAFRGGRGAGGGTEKGAARFGAGGEAHGWRTDGGAAGVEGGALCNRAGSVQGSAGGAARVDAAGREARGWNAGRAGGRSGGAI